MHEPRLRSLADQNALWTADKSEFVRPPELYGLFGEGARIRDRYGLADRDLWSEEAESYDGKFEGERWRDAFRMSDGPETLDAFLDPMAEDLGMRNICPNAGDVLVSSEPFFTTVLARASFAQPPSDPRMRFGPTADHPGGNDTRRPSLDAEGPDAHRPHPPHAHPAL